MTWNDIEHIKSEFVAIDAIVRNSVFVFLIKLVCIHVRFLSRIYLLSSDTILS